MSTFFSLSHFGKKILRKYFYRNASMFSTIANSSLILSSDVCCMMRRATSFRLSEGWQKATTTVLLRGCHLICSHQSPSAEKSQRLALVSRTSSILTNRPFTLGLERTSKFSKLGILDQEPSSKTWAFAPKFKTLFQTTTETEIRFHKLSLEV